MVTNMTLQHTNLEPGVLKLYYDEKALNPGESPEEFKKRLVKFCAFVFHNFTIKNMEEKRGHGFCLVVTLYHKTASEDWDV